MTTEHHLWAMHHHVRMANRARHDANHGISVLHSQAAAHHGLLAQECELCANMRRRMPPAIRERMARSECGGAGWIARAT